MKQNNNQYENFKTDDSEMRKFKSKVCSFMLNFSKDKDLAQDNSNLKYNQLNTIDKYGLIYFYNESGIYFLDNSKINLLFRANTDLSLSDLFFLKFKNIYKTFKIEEDSKIFLIICTKKEKNNENSNSFLIYIDIAKFIEKINSQKRIYDVTIIKDLEEKENIFKNGLIDRELNELEKNTELKEDEEYREQPQEKVETINEKKEKFKEEKEKILRERDEIFTDSYDKAVKYEPNKIIYLGDDFKDIIILDKDRYIVLKENGDIIFYNNYEINRIIQKNAEIIHYNKETSIFLIISHDYVYILKEKNNFNSLKEIKNFLLKNLLSSDNELIIFGENIFNYIVLYTIENNKNPKQDDKLYFIKMNERMDKIIKIYLEKQYFLPDDYEMKGISYDCHLKRTVFSVYDEEYKVYFIFNKHTDLMDKYYTFKKSDQNDNIYDLIYLILNDDNILNSRITNIEDNENDDIKKLKNNPFVGISFIKFKFDGYSEDREHIDGEDRISPYLILVLGFYGGFKIFYAINTVQEVDGYKLMEKKNCFRDTNNISNKVLEISINEEIIGMEREKYIYENNKKNKNFTELKNLKLLNNRNLFLHELDHQINENLEYFKNLAVPQKIKVELANLQKIANNPKIKEIQDSIDNLLEEAKDLFEKEDENQQFIDENKELIKSYKNIEINIKNDIKNIEDNKNISKELKLSINTPINELLLHPKVKNFLTEERVNNMIKNFNKIKNSYNLYDNHVNLISKMFLINENLTKQIEDCKDKYNSFRDLYKCLKNRKDAIEDKTQLQNNIFILYMRVFEEFFFNLENFTNNSLNKEYLYLNKLKANYLNSVKQLENDEEESDNISNSRNNGRLYHNNDNEEEKENNINNNGNRVRFVIREEEDIDEGNNSINSNEINDNIISTSSHKLNKFNIINNNDNNIDNDDRSGQNLILRNNRINNINNLEEEDNTISINNNYLVDDESNKIFNKIFGTKLVKEKDAPKKNYLIEILKDFEGRVTYYNKESEEDFCDDAEEFFEEFLIEEDEIKKRENKKKAKKEKREKDKINIIKDIQESLNRKKEERIKIEKELLLIDENNKKEIILRENENKELKNRLLLLEKKFEENKKERDVEKNKLIEQINKNNKKNEEQQKLKNEQNDISFKNKNMEEEIKNLKNKLIEEENKRKEIEEKNKKLEEDIKNNKTNNSFINPQNEVQDSNNNKNVVTNNINTTSLFKSNIQYTNVENNENKPDNNIFLQNMTTTNNNNNNNNDNNNNQNPPSVFNLALRDTNSIDSLLKNSQTNISQNNQNNNDNNTNQNTNINNLFRATSSSNNNSQIFSSKTTNTPKNDIFNFNTKSSVNNRQTSIFSQLPNTPIQTQNQPTNSIFGNLNINKENSSNTTSLFSNLNFGSVNQNSSNNISVGEQAAFGQHNNLGFGQTNNNVNKTSNLHVLHFGSSNTTSNPLNVSPFVGVTSGNLFNNQNQNKSNNDKDIYF